MKRILVALALVLTLIAFSAESCGGTSGNFLSGPGPFQVCTYQVDYTTTRWERTVPVPAPEQITEGSTVTHLVHSVKCHK